MYAAEKVSKFILALIYWYIEPAIYNRPQYLYNAYFGEGGFGSLEGGVGLSERRKIG